MMRLYFLRHGHAEPGLSVSDHARQLTPKGVARLQTAAKVMKRLKIKPTHLFSSPRVRAQQTAEIVAEQLNISVELREEVNFGFDTNAVHALIDRLPEGSQVMFVGHEPTFSMTVRAITGGQVAMKKGSLARVDLIDPVRLQGELVWLIAPKVFDALDD